MRVDGLFIGIEVDEAQAAKERRLAGHLAQVCPVDIYTEPHAGTVKIVEENVDECVLCRLCLDIAHLDLADDAVRVLKLYEDGTPL
ncbi:MAG: hypothetical protein M3296_00270 [Actinomycetota bacterium]|nr:hypothetical protein [Actinomycetota bacterium]